MKDLSRILILLNRRDDTILFPPDDWRTLLGWGERVLRRYKKHNPQEVCRFYLLFCIVVCDSSIKSRFTFLIFKILCLVPYQVDQLVNFLKIQTNNAVPSNLGDVPKSSSLTSFQPSSNPSSPQPVFPLGPVSGDWSDSCADDSLWDCTAMNDWPSAREFLDEDDFLTLGFRPQDEITTEL